MAVNRFAQLMLKLQADSSGLKKGFAQAKKQVSSFEKAIRGIGGAIAAAFSISAIKGFISATLKAYDVQAKAERQLLVALQGRTDVQQSLIRQAKQLQTQTLFGDEETIQAQAMLAAFVRTEETLKQVTPLVQDMAVGLGMDLKGAASLVAKTLGSTTNALARYGIVVEGAVGSSERLNSLVASLADKFQGQAKAAAEVGTGRLTQLKNILSDLGEQVGGLIVDLTDMNKNLVSINETLAKIELNKDVFRDVFKAIQAGNPLHYLMLYNKELIKLLNLSKSGWSGGGGSMGTPQMAAPNMVSNFNSLVGSSPQWKRLAALERSAITRGTPNIGGFTASPYFKQEKPGKQSLNFEATQRSLDQLQIFGDRINGIAQSHMVDLSGTFAAGINDIATVIGEGFADLFTGDFGLKDFTDNILMIMGGFLKQMGSMLIAYGIGMDAFKKAFANPWAAIAAGVALVGIGSAISKLAASGPSGISSTPGTLQTNPIQVQGVLRGEDIYYASQKAQNRIIRTGG